jgi:hypothetical protein
MSLANLFVASADRVQFAFVILHLYVQFPSRVTRPNSNVHCQHRYLCRADIHSLYCMSFCAVCYFEAVDARRS